MPNLSPHNSSGQPKLALVEAQSPTGSAPGQYSFANGKGQPTPAWPCLVTAGSGGPYRIKINANNASASDYDVMVPANTTVDISFEKISVFSLSIWTGATAAHGTAFFIAGYG